MQVLVSHACKWLAYWQTLAQRLALIFDVGAGNVSRNVYSVTTTGTGCPRHKAMHAGQRLSQARPSARQTERDSEHNTNS